MNRFQPFDFGSVEEFLDFLPSGERKVVEALRTLVLSSVPDVREKLSYNVPFYSRNKRMFYIWPPAVPWGKHRDGGVHFGFCYGYLLSDPYGLLEKGNRKQVFYQEYRNAREIEKFRLIEFIYSAIELDDGFTGKRRGKSGR